MSDNETDSVEESKAPLIEHLVELRNRLMKSVIAVFIGFVVCFFFASDIFNILIVPYEKAAGKEREIELIFTAPQEYFFTQLKLAFFGSMILMFPVLAGQIYRFVAPGLYKNEKGAFLPFLFATPILFAIGASLVYFFIMPMAMSFFLSMEQQGGPGVATIRHLPKVSEYLGLVTTLIFAFGLVFQLPVALSLLGKAGIVSSAGLATKRKYAVVVAFIMAAVLTPPDPVSQIGLAVPTLLLYEISILCVRLIERKRAAREEEEADELA
ncbi:MAG: twin-arginine translocase subunit TatC [Hyphomicrobiales bacterium]|nr:MAG: twin-arginine translocase subunit TatC [Hyphomicrobiales bacterium]